MFPQPNPSRGNTRTRRIYARNMPPRRSAPITLVLARNLQDFHAWCREQGRSPRDRTLLYASGPHALRGLADVEICIVRYGAWWDRVDRHALEEAVAWLLHHRDARLLEAAHV